MPDMLLALLSGEETVHHCSLATVTTRCVVIRTFSARSRAIVSLDCIERMESVKTSYPALLAIAAGLFLIAAAAYYSKDGGSAHGPVAALATFFVVAYLVSRKAAVVFWTGRESLQSINGGLRESAALMRAVRKAQREVSEMPAETAIAS